MPHLTRNVVLAAAGFALLPLAGPAFARSDKTPTVRLPANLLKDPAARLCMPKSVLPKPAPGTPATVCQTKDDWAAAGVTVLAR